MFLLCSLYLFAGPQTYLAHVVCGKKEFVNYRLTRLTDKHDLATVLQTNMCLLNKSEGQHTIGNCPMNIWKNKLTVKKKPPGCFSSVKQKVK